MRQFLQRSALRTSPGGPWRGSADLLPLGLGAAHVFGSAGADQIALYVGEHKEVSGAYPTSDDVAPESRYHNGGRDRATPRIFMLPYDRGWASSPGRGDVSLCEIVPLEQQLGPIGLRTGIGKAIAHIQGG